MTESTLDSTLSRLSVEGWYSSERSLGRNHTTPSSATEARRELLRAEMIGVKIQHSTRYMYERACASLTYPESTD